MTACRQYESWDSERCLQASTHSMKWKTYAHFGITAHSLVNVRERKKKNASRHAYDREIGLRRFEGRANDNGVSAAKCQEFCDSDGGQHMFECQKERERRRFQEAAKKNQTFNYDRECGVTEQRKAKTYSGWWQIGAVTSINTSWYKTEEEDGGRPRSKAGRVQSQLVNDTSLFLDINSALTPPQFLLLFLMQHGLTTLDSFAYFCVLLFFYHSSIINCNFTNFLLFLRKHEITIRQKQRARTAWTMTALIGKDK